MFKSTFMGFRVIIVPVLFMIIISQVALSQSEVERRFKQRSVSGYELCFNKPDMCPEPFVAAMNNCLKSLEETQDEETFGGCICAIHSNSRPAWRTCSECLSSNYKDTTLVVWDRECSFNSPTGEDIGLGWVVSGGKVCKC